MNKAHGGGLFYYLIDVGFFVTFLCFAKEK